MSSWSRSSGSKPSNSCSLPLSLNILNKSSCPRRKFAAILLMKTRPAYPHKKMHHLPSKPMKKWNSCRCKSLSDWVRYLVIVTCTGKSGIFQGQPVSLRGSNPDYSGRSASRVKFLQLTDRCDKYTASSNMMLEIISPRKYIFMLPMQLWVDLEV